jgi:hypothetical protein
MVTYLPAEQRALVKQARDLGLSGVGEDPAYLSPELCTALAFLLALPTLGFSLVFVPIFWVVQHEHTDHVLAKLRQQLEVRS